MLNFTLTYDGPVPSGSKGAKIEEKQAIRRALHPQLAKWWETGALAQTWKELPEHKTLWDAFIHARLSHQTPFVFLPVVTKFLEVVCELDILFLRPEEPGAIIKNDGDIDNRLKVIFDALRMPKDAGEVPHGDVPLPEERPYFCCLLEDDSLITKVTLRTDRLLLLNPDPNHVRLIIDVGLRASHLTTLNFPIGT
jgi:hypothetical protein